MASSGPQPTSDALVDALAARLRRGVHVDVVGRRIVLRIGSVVAAVDAHSELGGIAQDSDRLVREWSAAILGRTDWSVFADLGIPSELLSAPLLKDLFARHSHACVDVVGSGRLAGEVCRRLGELGLVTRTVATLNGDVPRVVVCALENDAYSVHEEIADACARLGVPSISVAIEGDEVLVGPLTLPGLHADILSVRAALASESVFGQSLPREEIAAVVPRWRTGGCEDVEPWILSAACHQLALLVLRVLEGKTSRTTTSVIVDRMGAREIDLPLPPARPIRASAQSGRNIVLIVGSQRSGTTMLGNHLARAYDLAYYDEDEAYSRLGRAEDPSGGRLSLFKVPMWTASLGFLRYHFPAARYIFLRRPLLQVTASMLSLRDMHGRSWAERFALRECRLAIDQWPDRDVATEWLEELGNAREPFRRAALCAFLKSAYGAFYEASGANVLAVDYDALVADPEATIARIVAFTGSVRRDGDPDAPPQTMLIGQTDGARPIDSRSTAKYQSVLSAAQIVEIRRLEERWQALIASAGAVAMR